MDKIKNLISSEKKLSSVIFSLMAFIVFALIFGPNVYAQFVRETGSAGWGYGYGYGYGYGFGVNDGSYRVDGGNLSSYDYGYGYGNLQTITQSAISGVTAPVSGATPVSTIASTTQYTATISWSPADSTFGSGKVYRATITITPKPGYTLQGVPTNFFTVTGATATNSADSGIITATFPATSSSGGGGGGGGGVTPSCQSVVYSDYSPVCANGYQYRDITSRNPTICNLTSEQIEAARRVCGSVINPPVPGGSTGEDFGPFIANEKSLVKKINRALTKRLLGRILLQVQEKGQAWYVNPTNSLKYFLGRPADAFAIMRKFGLGVSEKDYNSFKGVAPARLSGRILLRVHAHGEAYYVNPLDRKLYYMGRPADAFNLMRRFGLGITNSDLRQIEVGELK